MDSAVLDKINRKRLYKIRGKVSEVSWIRNGSLARIIIYKGVGKKKKFYSLTGWAKLSTDIMALKKDDRVKIWFNIESKQTNPQTWYNNLNAEIIEYWPVNEDKELKKQKDREYFADKKYEKSAANNNDAFLGESK